MNVQNAPNEKQWTNAFILDYRLLSIWSPFAQFFFSCFSWKGILEWNLFQLVIKIYL